MSDATYRRLTRYAAFAAIHFVFVVALLVAPRAPDWAAIAVFVTAAPFLVVWGHFHADLAMNPLVDDDIRRRWRVLLYLFVWSAALYWYRYVRPRRLD